LVCWKKSWLHEIKFDGYRVIARKGGERVIYGAHNIGPLRRFHAHSRPVLALPRRSDLDVQALVLRSDHFALLPLNFLVNNTAGSRYLGAGQLKIGVREPRAFKDRESACADRVGIVKLLPSQSDNQPS
jgi:hypothetical protein